jgi:hypothetical protein
MTYFDRFDPGDRVALNCDNKAMGRDLNNHSQKRGAKGTVIGPWHPGNHTNYKVEWDDKSHDPGYPPQNLKLIKRARRDMEDTRDYLKLLEQLS